MKFGRKIFTLTLLSLILSGCASAPTHFYVLNHLGAKSCERGRHQIDIGIGPVTLPKYLNQPQIVTREFAHKLNISEQNRWAEALDDNVTRVLGDNLTTLLPACRVFTYPWTQNTPVKLRVSVDIRQFELLTKECTVVLRANWTIHHQSDNKSVISCCKDYRIPYSGEVNYHKIARLMSQALYQMSVDIAKDARRDLI